MVVTNLSLNSRSVDCQEVKPLASHMRTDDISKTKDVKSHSVEIVKPLLKLRKEDNIVSLCQGNSKMELDLGFNVVKMRGEVSEDKAPSKFGENLCESPCVIVEKEEDKEKPCLEFPVDVFDKETRTWLLSKQNALYLHEDYGR